MAAARLRKAAFGVFLIGVAGSWSLAASFELREIFVRVPRETPGFVSTQDLPDELQGIYRIEGWINVPPRRTIVEKQPPGSDAFFAALGRLLQAYRDRDPEQFVALHRAQAQQDVIAKLEDPALRDQWMGFVGTIEELEPEIVWVAGDQLGSIVKMHLRDPADGSLAEIVTPLIFDHEFRLFGEPLGPEQNAILSNLTWYFTREDVVNEAKDLIVNIEYVQSISE